MQVFAILGIHPELSLAELRSVLERSPSHFSDEAALFDEVGQDPEALQRRLGGTQKLGIIIEHTTNVEKDHLAEFLGSLLIQSAEEGKVTYGISVYDLGDTALAKRLEEVKTPLGLEMKSYIKKAGHNARFVTSRKKTLSAADVKKNQILTRGAEFCLFASPDGLYVGQTLSIQDIDDWSHRDFERPARNARRGMLPPKLARMMVNLAGSDFGEKTLLDPFCGSGTVLMEAALVGYEHLFGNDLSREAVADTKENLSWLEKQGFNMPSIRLSNGPAADMAKTITPESVHALVTEPFLGQPRTGKETPKDIERTVKELFSLYQTSFRSLHALLTPDARMVVAIPVHFIGTQAFPLNLTALWRETGFSPVQEPILYWRKGQFVGRHICVVKKQ